MCVRQIKKVSYNIQMYTVCLENYTTFANYLMQMDTIFTATAIRMEKKCDLCKFSEFFHDNTAIKYLFTYRNNKQKLLKMLDNYWFFVSKISRTDRTALDFFNTEYTWKFKDYRKCKEIEMTLDEVITSDFDMIELNGVENFFKFCLH